jgi:hypothetical protein
MSPFSPNRTRTLSCLSAILGLLMVSFDAAVAAAPKEFTPEQRNHWAFRNLSEPPIPKTRSSWGQNSIDPFILHALEAKKIQPNPPADKITLLRRATFDLTGLPPTPEEIDAFLADHSAEAFERVIDRLLLSPHYGERWARHWLDLARYAESEGFKADETRPNAWRYRDYVIKSFNDDKPYERFLSEQIAGDELWPDDPQALIATGFNRHYPDESNARNLMQRRQEILNDITDTVGAVFTGLTFSCARCHDHKFDPILQKDYYRLQAFFANTAATDNIPLISGAKLGEYHRKLAAWESATAEIRAQMAELEKPECEAVIQEFFEKYPAEIQVALKKSPAERSPYECQMVAKAELYLNPDSHQYIAKSSIAGGRLKGEQKKHWDALNARLKEFAHLHPGPLPAATGIADLNSESPKTYVLKGGSWEAPTDEVQPGFLSILNPSPTPIIKPAVAHTTGRRTALARLLTDPSNPLTARVFVNRVWQHHFHQGIAATPSDLGFKGERPTHPELLDWLAAQFVKQNWSIKSLHKLIMLSATYQQSSDFRADAASLDPDDKLLWRYPRQRLEAEVIRDAALTVSGLLNREMGGPSVFPELPAGMQPYGSWKTSEPQDRNRRSIYVFVRRNMRYPMFETFDMPDTHESCSRRNSTTSPLQALTMLNNKVTLEWAQAFAGRILPSAGPNRDRQIELAFRLAYSRIPSTSELSLARKFFDNHASIIAERARNSEPLALPTLLSLNVPEADAATLVDFCHMLLNSNEFVYVN